MGAHVGPARSHTTARVTSAELRAFTALFGHMGIEADVRDFSSREQEVVARAIGLHKRHRAMIHSGRLLRLEYPDPGAAAFLVAGRDVLVSVAQLETPAYATPANLRLPGLDPDMRYRARLLNPPAHPRRSMKRWPSLVDGPVETTGALLAAVGLPLPILRAGELAVFHLEPV